MQNRLENMPVVVLTGMRQVGKTTMLVNDKAFSNRDYLSLVDIASLTASNDDPVSLLSAYERVTIDEAQRSEPIFPAIKRILDEQRVKGRFLLSGSASLPLRKAAAESLAGHAVYLRMMPMTRREIGGEIGGEPFIIGFAEEPGLRRGVDFKPITDNDVARGGLPPVVLAGKEEAKIWLSGYEQTYLERDIRILSRVNNIIGFRGLLRLVAVRTAQLLNVSDLSRDAEMSYNTTKRYLGWMEDLFFIYRLPVFRGSRTTRIRKQSKVYVSDSGLACHLAGIHDLPGDMMRGHVYETYVAQNILGIMESRAPDWELYYWRSNSGEIDFVLDTRKGILAIEVKSGAAWKKKDVSMLRSFVGATPGCIGGIIAYNGSEMIKLGERIWAVPLGLLLS